MSRPRRSATALAAAVAAAALSLGCPRCAGRPAAAAVPRWGSAAVGGLRRQLRPATARRASSSEAPGGWESFAPVAQGRPPVTYRRLDHIVLRCKDVQRMLDFYVGVLGAEPEWVGRMGGCLSHLRIGSSLIDLQGYVSPMGRRLHGGGAGLPEDAPVPPCDAKAGTLDHFAINVDPYDAPALRKYLTERGHPPFSEGERYGADGTAYSMYLRDPEGNVVELKCGGAAE